MPYTIRVHQVSGQNATGEEVFRSIPETKKPDDDFINANTNRFPATERHCLRCVEYDDDGEPKQLRVLVGGAQIFKPLKNLWLKHSSVTTFDVEITATGEKKAKTYHVTASPMSNELDVEEWVNKVVEDADWAFEALFPEITADEQERIITEAGIDLSYDPVAELAEDMSPDDALDVLFPVGKYGPEKHPPKGLSVREVLKIDSGYIAWAAEKMTSNNSAQAAAACRVVIENLEAIQARTPKQVGKGKAAAAPKEEKVKFVPRGKKAAAPPPEEELAPWPIKQEPAAYLDRWAGRGGKYEALARAHLEAAGTPYEDKREEDEEGLADGEKGESSNATVSGHPGNKAVTPPPQVGKKAAAKAAAPVDKKANGANGAGDLQTEITTIFADDERFQDPMEIVKIIRKHGDGKPRLKDLNGEQMAALYRELVTA